MMILEYRYKSSGWREYNRFATREAAESMAKTLASAAAPAFAKGEWRVREIA